MARRTGWPEWWGWELELSVHVRRRMPRRDFNEAELRGMLEDAEGIREAKEVDRWVISTRRHGTAWEIVVQPDHVLRRLVVVTAYAVE